jgi:hypothetical protein
MWHRLPAGVHSHSRAMLFLPAKIVYTAQPRPGMARWAEDPTENDDDEEEDWEVKLRAILGLLL